MVGYTKRRLERLAGLKCDICKIGDADCNPLDMPFSAAKPYAIARVCRPQNSQVPLIEGKMDVVTAEEVEHSDFRGLSGHATTSST